MRHHPPRYSLVKQGYTMAGTRPMPLVIAKELVQGVPACALSHAVTVLDWTLPRVMAGHEITRAQIAALAHGGYCQNCADCCRFPICGFDRNA